MNAEASNHRFEVKLGRAIVAIKVLDALGLTVSHVDLGAQRPEVRIVHPHNHLRPGAEIEGCAITWPPVDDDDELPPCVGERIRDVTFDIARNGVDA